MSKLKDIVPPLELCNRIPAGEFGESALVWREETPAFVCGASGAVDPKPMWFVVPRKRSQYGVSTAPTLAEILAELPDFTVVLDGDGVWRIFDSEFHEKANSPATAALRLWLKLEGIDE